MADLFINRPKTKLTDYIKNRSSVEGILKLFSDAILINLAVLTALAARLLYIIAYTGPQSSINYRETFWEYVKAYSSGSWLLTIISIIVFMISGFYTYGRFYRGRYKILVVAQAVTVSYLIFGFLSYLAQGPLLAFMSDFLNLPRGTMILAWLLTVLFLVVSRAWVTLWESVVRIDRRRNGNNNRVIRRVLVIGGAGYIGSALVPLLLEKGYQVRILDLLIYGNEPIQSWLNNPHLELIQGDFRQIDVVVSAMQDVDAVIHLGAIVGDPACNLDENLTLEINLMATKLIAEVAKGCQVGHFIFASTCSVYGASDQPLDEHSAIKPVTIYARSKAASEKVLLKMADERFSPVILRFSTVYGLSGRYRFDLVVNLLTAKAMVDGEITIFGGNQWRSFVHVEDAARGIMAALDARLEVVSGEIFNVGSNEQNYSISRIGEMIHSFVPTAKIVNKGNEIDPLNYRVNFNKISRLLNFSPKWTVEQGIEQVIHAVRSGQVKDYKEAQYSNIKFLSGAGMDILDRHENGWAARLLDETF
jgi:nucleoside-diphosphate-sugar epimerase